MPAWAARDASGAVLNAMAQARIAEEENRPAAALMALTTLASHAPTLPGLRGRMLEQAIEAGDLAAARSAAAALWQAGDLRFDAQLVLVVDAMRRSDWKGAQAYLDGRSGKTGADLGARLIHDSLDAWIAVGRRDAAAEAVLLRAGGGARPEPALLLEAALVQLARGRVQEGVELSDAVTLTDRTSQLVALRLAATFDRVKQGAAADRLRKRIALAAGGREDPALMLPDRSVLTPRQGGAHWLALIADGMARTPNSSAKVPLLFARAAYWLDPDDWTARAALVEALDRNERGADALALLDAGRQGLPPVLAMRRAELLGAAGDHGGAIASAEAALAENPSDRALLIRFADVARQSDDRAATLRAYRRLGATLEEGDAELQGMLLIAEAEILLQDDAWDAAARLMERAVALRPDDAMVLNFAGYSAIERRKDVPRSLARIEAAWKLEPQNASITDSLGWAYFLTGRVGEAVPLLEQAERGEPDNAVIVEHLGDAYWQAGRHFQARYAWRAAALVAETDMATRIAAKLRDGLTPATTAP